jgi:hypothetical protein
MEPGAFSHTELVQRIGLPMHQSKGWLKFLGVMSILWGVCAVLFTLGIGIVFAWLPIWMGVLLYQSAELADRAYTSGDEASLVASLSKLKLYFVITGILMLIGLAFFMVVASLGMLGALSGLARLPR